jgi:hypothetical protein
MDLPPFRRWALRLFLFGSILETVERVFGLVTTRADKAFPNSLSTVITAERYFDDVAALLS